MEIKKVIVIFKTHLDIGFTDFSSNVVEKYMDEFIPNALKIAKELRQAGSEARFVWTTGSWLIHEYLRTHTGFERQQLEEGIRNKDICWHGLPFTTHTEMMSGSLFEYGLSLSQRLDAHFGKKTIAAKMTDVPGHTKAMIPYLRRAGIEFLHIGVNPASTVPEVPPLFRWQADDGQQLTVMYQKDYGEFTQIGNSDTAVYFAHTGDNIGTQSKEKIEEIFAELKAKLPGAQIVAGDLNDLAYAVRQVENTLPIITEEIGDTWIHGVGTDPGKVSSFRALERLYDTMSNGRDKEVLAQGLLMIPEHTWGLDVKTHLQDHAHYDMASFQKQRQEAPNYKKMELSWQEQRRYLLDAVDTLSAQWKVKAKHALAQAVREATDVSAMRRARDGEILDLGPYRIRFGVQGQIVELACEAQKIADEKHPLLEIHYEQFSGKDYDRFYSQYNRLDVQWAREDFKKPGMEEAAKEHIRIEPSSSAVYVAPEKIVVKYRFSVGECGCPAKMEAVITENEGNLHIDLAWFDKQANRIAEAIWVDFCPIGKNKRIRKLGSWIDPTLVVKKGQHCLHGTDHGIRYDELEIQTLDAALIAPAGPSLLDFESKDIDGSGVSINLYNNVWGTNFPMWHDEDARFRFVLVPRKK